MSVPWDRLSRHQRKAELYAGEPRVAAAWADFRARWGEDAESAVARLAVVVLKPEAVVRRAGPTVVGYLAAHGFAPVAWRPLELGPERCRTLWRYQWNKASADRVDLHLEVASLSPWFMIVFRDEEPVPGLPASVRLWGLKGQTDERLRDPGQLRSAIGMQNRMLGFVHTPDEPLDIVREQGILVEPGARRDWLREVADGLDRERPGEAVAALAAFDRDLPRHGIDREEVLARQSASSAPQRAELAAAVRAGERRSLAQVREAFGEPEDATAAWDRVVLAAWLIEHDRAGVAAIVDAGEFAAMRRAWLQGVAA